METAKNFTLDMYTLNGGIISILFDKDLTPKNKLYKNAIHRGFVSWDKDILKNMAPPVSEEVYSDEKLGQDDIDKLIEKLSKEMF